MQRCCKALRKNSQRVLILGISLSLLLNGLLIRGSGPEMALGASYPGMRGNPVYNGTLPFFTHHDARMLLPFITANFHSANSFPKVLGLYTNDWIGYQETIDNEMRGLENWSGKGLTIGGTFVDFTSNPEWMIRDLLTHIWNNGYTPFVNLGTSDPSMTIRNIVRGNANTYFRNIARNYKIFADNGNRMAFMAPFQEMNGDWVPYASPDPNDYITAFHIIRNIFIEEGVPEQSVRWVFAPNGSSTSGYPGFEAYYPGSAYVDVIAFSAYHFGYCDWAPPSWRGWLTPQVAIGTYLERALAIDPGKPVFIAQTATSSETRQGPNHAAKDAWLSEAYNYFLDYPNLKAILYFNFYDPADGAQCDWAIYVPGGERYEGYRQTIANPEYQYLSPLEMKDASIWSR